MTVDEAREAMNRAIHTFISVSDGFVNDGEMLGDYVFIAHVVDINDPEKSRYYTISNPENLPTHCRIGLHSTALDIITDQRWDHEGPDE